MTAAEALPSCFSDLFVPDFSVLAACFLAGFELVAGEPPPPPPPPALDLPLVELSAFLWLLPLLPEPPLEEEGGVRAPPPPAAAAAAAFEAPAFDPNAAPLALPAAAPPPPAALLPPPEDAKRFLCGLGLRFPLLLCDLFLEPCL